MISVYEEQKFELIRSSHSDKDVYYRIFFGTVNWTKSVDGKLDALTIFMQYGDTADFKIARKGEIQFQMPAHILKEDIEKVQLATQLLLDRVKG